MKFKEIRERPEAERNLLEVKLRKELADLTLQARSGQLANTAKIGNIRKDIARILTAKRKVS